MNGGTEVSLRQAAGNVQVLQRASFDTGSEVAVAVASSPQVETASIASTTSSNASIGSIQATAAISQRTASSFSTVPVGLLAGQNTGPSGLLSNSQGGQFASSSPAGQLPPIPTYQSASPSMPQQTIPSVPLVQLRHPGAAAATPKHANLEGDEGVGRQRPQSMQLSARVDPKPTAVIKPIGPENASLGQPAGHKRSGSSSNVSNPLDVGFTHVVHSIRRFTRGHIFHFLAPAALLTPCQRNDLFC